MKGKTSALCIIIYQNEERDQIAILKIPNRITISQRPKPVNTREEFGHFETDSIVSRESEAGLNVITERK